MPAVPAVLRLWMASFATAFTRPTWHHLLVLVAGTVLGPGRRTVTAALSVMGRRAAPDFANFHHVLSRNRWSGRDLARRLLTDLVAAFVPEGPVIVGIDETIERRWGPRISARGIYRDPVRSSKQHLVKASGLRWISVMVLVPLPWARRVWALPVLSALAPSERYAQDRGRRHKTLTDWGRQMLLQVARWLPDRPVVAVADASYAALELLSAVRHRVTVITRLRLDARLFDPPPERPPGTRGRPAKKGARQPTLAQRLDDPATSWSQVTVCGWYGGVDRLLEITTGTALWSGSGLHVPIRYILVRDPSGQLEPQGFLCTDPTLDAVLALTWFVRRWCIEVTFAEVRRHLGVETQRQWSDVAIARTTPMLLGLFSLITLWTNTLITSRQMAPRVAAWYPKQHVTFSDALAAVRRHLWVDEIFGTSRDTASRSKSDADLFGRLIDVACFPA